MTLVAHRLNQLGKRMKLRFRWKRRLFTSQMACIALAQELHQCLADEQDPGLLNHVMPRGGAGGPIFRYPAWH
jgi:hypothetical protein